jgi:hypothetical protein
LEKVANVVLREDRPRFRRNLNGAIPFPAADATRKAFDLKATVWSEIVGGVDKRARVEGNPRQPIEKAYRRHRLRDDHVRSGISSATDSLFAGVTAHQKDRDGPIFVVDFAAKRERES